MPGRRRSRARCWTRKKSKSTSAPKPAVWQSLEQYGTFIVMDEDEEQHPFSLNDIAAVVPVGRYSEDIPLDQHWMAKVKEIRSTPNGEVRFQCYYQWLCTHFFQVWVKVNWYYAPHEVSEKIPSFDASHCAKRERIYSHHTEIISGLTFEAPVRVVDFLEDDPDQIHILHDEFFCRYFFHANGADFNVVQYTSDDQISATPNPSSPGCNPCSCGKPYSPEDMRPNQVMHWCPRPCCRRAYHRACLLDRTTFATRHHLLCARLASSADTDDADPVIVPDDANDTMSQLPVDLLRLAGQPIVRGGVYGVVGNVAVVVRARRVVHATLRVVDRDSSCDSEPLRIIDPEFDLDLDLWEEDAGFVAWEEAIVETETTDGEEGEVNVGFSDCHHLLFVAFPAWGHTRPLCVLGSRLAAERADVVITILMAPRWLQQAKLEIAAQFPADHEALARIRIISLFQSDAVRPTELVGPLAKFYPTAYQAIFRGEAITCATTKTPFSALPAPVAVIMDFFSIVQLQQTRAIGGTTIPILAFASCASAAIIRLFAPESLGGLGDFGAKTDAEALRTGKSSAEIGDRIFKHTEGRVIRIAGLPPMYDHEFFPQNLPWDVPMTPIVRSGHAMLTQCDGVFINTCEAYDKESLYALDHWISSALGKPLYATGPLLPPADGSRPSLVNPHEVEIHKFLDNVVTEYGKNSTLLVSFGTLFWPTVADYLDELIDVLIEKKFPFILCHASPVATVSPGLRDKIQTSDVGIITPWCPQQFILSHPATGWFLSHCGHGGISEALSNGIPIICWPFDGDQPAATAHLTQNLDAAFHLIEVRTGKGLQPLFSGQVPQGTRQAVGEEFRRTIDACRSDAGERKRKNARRLGTELSKAWEGGGSAKIAINMFLERIVVDDTDPAIQYGPTGWFVADSTKLNNIGNYGPVYNGTSHSAVTNASLSFPFNGTSISVLGTIAVTADANNVTDPAWDCFVDDVKIDNPNPTFPFPENNWPLCGQDQIASGTHTLTIQVQSKGQPFYFDQILYTPLSTVNYDGAVLEYLNSDPAVSFGTGWRQWDTHLNVTQTNGAQVALNFHGTAVSLFGYIPHELPHNSTSGSYTIDGGSPVPFTLPGLAAQSATVYNALMFKTNTLTPATHNLVVTYAGDTSKTPLAVGAFYVTNTSTPSSGTSTSDAPANSPSSDSSNSTVTTEKKSSPVAAIVGGTIGCLAVLALIVGLIFWCRRRRRREAESVRRISANPFTMSATDTTPASAAATQYTYASVPADMHGYPYAQPETPGTPVPAPMTTYPYMPPAASLPSSDTSNYAYPYMAPAASLSPSDTSNVAHRSHAHSPSGSSGPFEGSIQSLPMRATDLAGTSGGVLYPTPVPSDGSVSSGKYEQELRASAALPADMPLTPQRRGQHQRPVVLERHQDSGVRLQSMPPSPISEILDLPPGYTRD
ncbi:hypothetical protein B0H19DRAFT_1375565 [Mycena capillaripes]|nr:hypothetical protein B0H19DRAFT_1375565 [Mycena capillaripes]